MKPLICAILSLLFFFPATAQTYVLQAGRQYLVVNQDGSVRLDDRPSTLLYLGLEGQIYTKDHNLYLATDSDRDRRIHFTPAEAKADKLIFEANPSGSGRFITKRFYEGALYLVVSGPQLKWRKSHSEGIPVLLLRQRTTNETGRTSTSRERSREEIGAAQKRQQDAAAAAAAAAEKRRQEENRVKPPKPATGSITVRLENFDGDITDYYAVLVSKEHPKVMYPRQNFNVYNKLAAFSGLEDGSYEVKLWKKYEGSYDAQCECGDNIKGNKNVTIFKGESEPAVFKFK